MTRKQPTSFTTLFELTYRMAHRDGGWRGVLNRGQVIEREDKSRLLRAAGTDIVALNVWNLELSDGMDAPQVDVEAERFNWHDVDGADWTGITPEDSVAQILTMLEQHNRRGMVLLHDPFSRSAWRTRLLLQSLKSEGYRVVALEQPGN